VVPVYETALLIASRDRSVDVSLATPEARPLEQFGGEASDAVADALADAGITFTGGDHRFAPGTAERIVTVPLIRGPQIAGLPNTGIYGLVPVDRFGRVRRVPDTYAIGDMTDFPIKQAAIACEEADVAAADVAARYGHAAFAAAPARRLRATLLTGKPQPLVLNGGQGHGKLPGRHLAPFLADRVNQTAA
jgi:sulfide:quinone oxidoreductase